MKAVRFHAYGDPSVLVVEDAPSPELARDQVLVRVHAAAINRIDAKARRGTLRTLIAHSLPLIPGWDFAGVVVATGERVFGRADVTRDGACAEYVAVDANALVPLSKHIDFAHAAALPTAALTAWQALDALRLRNGDALLVVGAHGGVGSFAVQLARLRGAHVTAIGRRDDVDALDERFDGVLDLAGVDATSALKPGGAFVSTVRAPVKNDDARELRATTIGMRFDRAQLDEIADLVVDGSLHVPIAEVMPLDETERAHRLLERGGVRGKLVVRVV